MARKHDERHAIGVMSSRNKSMQLLYQTRSASLRPMKIIAQSESAWDDHGCNDAAEYLRRNQFTYFLCCMNLSQHEFIATL